MRLPTVRTRVPFAVILAAAAIVASAISAARRFAPPLFINITPSEPRGIYRLHRHTPSTYVQGMYVIFPVPKEVQSLVYGRRWLPPGTPFLKEILGLDGDKVCISPQGLNINGRLLGSMFELDSQGLALPQSRGCQLLKTGTFFAASTYLDRSFDGRYFGPQPLSSIIGEAVPLWTY